MAKKRFKPTKDQVAVWMEFLFQPALDLLEAELHWLYLDPPNPSWRHHKEALEYFAPVAARIRADARPLLEQFLRAYPKFERRIAAHDEAVAELRNAAQAGFQTLVASREFKALVDREHAAYVQAHPEDREWYGAGPESNRLAIAAQYVVNAVKPTEVPHGYTTPRFWSEHGAAILAFQDASGALRDLYRAAERAKSAISVLFEALRDLRDEVADRFGLPAVILT